MKRDFGKLLRSGVILSSLVFGMTACSVTQQPPDGTKEPRETGNVTVLAETSTIDVLQEIADLSADFNSGKVEYDEAKKKLDQLASENASMKFEIEEMKKELTELNASKQAFINAQDSIEKGQYDDAVNYLSEVIEADSNYSDAQVLFGKSREKYKSQLEENISKCAESGNISGMRTSIGVAEKYLSEEDIKDLSGKLDQAEKTYQETLDKKVEARKIEVEKDIAEEISNKDYKKAVALCASSSGDPEGYDWNAWYSGKKKEVEDQWVSDSINEAEDCLKRGAFEDATGSLNAAFYNVTDTSRIQSEYDRISDFTPKDLASFDVFFEERLDKEHDTIWEVWEYTDRDSTGASGNTGILFKNRYGMDVFRAFGGGPEAYEVGYLLNGEYNHLKGTLSLTQGSKNTKHQLYIKVYGDEKLLYTSPKFTSGSLPMEMDVDVTGVTILKIVYCFDDAPDGYSYNMHFVILNPVLSKDYTPLP